MEKILDLIYAKDQTNINLAITLAKSPYYKADFESYFKALYNAWEDDECEAVSKSAFPEFKDIFLEAAVIILKDIVLS